MKKINQELFIAILDDDPDFAYVLSRMIEKVLGAGKVQVHIQTFRTPRRCHLTCCFWMWNWAMKMEFSG